MRRIGLIGVSAVFLAMAWTSTAHAANAWYTAEVFEVGVAPSGNVAMLLSDTDSPPAFTKTYFLLTEDPNKNLAIGLTALSIGSDVWIYVNLDALGTPRILAIYARR